MASGSVPNRLPFHNLPTAHSNDSNYTLHTVHDRESIQSEEAPLWSPTSSSYGSFAQPQSRRSSRKVILHAGLKMAAIFIVGTAILGGTLYLALPTLEEADRPSLQIPRSFEQLQDLNKLLKKYRDIHPYRILVCYVITYLFLQAFSLPGSMYLSILGGAVWGVGRALPLACACVATGATLCYLLSAALGPALLTLPSFSSRLLQWQEKLEAQKENIIPFLIVLRIAPLPPHWVVNVVCPHVGIGIIPFWISTFLGILGVTVIHTTIGGGLDEMTGADDFNLISWKNFFGLSAIVVGVLIPVGLRYYFKREVEAVVIVEENESDAVSDIVLESGPPTFDAKKGKQAAPAEEEEFYEDDDSDVILEAGPLIDIDGDDEDKSKPAEGKIIDL